MSTQRLTGLPARASAACISSRSIEPSPGVRVKVRVRVRVRVGVRVKVRVRVSFRAAMLGWGG